MILKVSGIEGNFEAEMSCDVEGVDKKMLYSFSSKPKLDNFLIHAWEVFEQEFLTE